MKRKWLFLPPFFLVFWSGCGSWSMDHDQYVETRDAINQMASSQSGAEVYGRFLLYEPDSELARTFRTMWHAHAREICDSLNVSFTAFDRASKKYGLRQMTFTEELNRYVEKLLESFQEPDTGLYLEEMLERMEYDLGLLPTVTLVEVTSEGEIKVNGASSSIDSVSHKVLEYLEKYGRLHLMCGPDVPAGRVFEVAGHLPWKHSPLNIALFLCRYTRGRVWAGLDREELADSLNKPASEPIPSDRQETPFPGVLVVAEVTADYELFFNFCPIQTEDWLQEKSSKLFEAEPVWYRRAIVTASDDVEWGKVIVLVEFLKDAGAEHVIVVPHEMFAPEYEEAELMNVEEFDIDLYGKPRDVINIQRRHIPDKKVSR